MIEVRSPWNGEMIAELPPTRPAELETMLARADELHRRAPAPPPHLRIAVLERAAALIDSRAETLAAQSAREGGKPLIDSRVEIARAADTLRHCAATLRTRGGEEVPMGLTAATEGRLAVTTHAPIGPVVAISAFNHPFNLVAHQVGPAVAAGCPVIVKPSLRTPLSCLALVDIMREAGLEDGRCQAALAADADAQRLSTDPRTAFLSFVGSAKVGWRLRSLLAPGTRCALEHGGAAPVFVSDDADLELAVPALLKGGFYHAGQVCVSVQRVFIVRALADELVERLAGGARRLVVGDPLVARTEVGPLIATSEVKRVETWVKEACWAGAKVAAGGEPVSARAYSPTVLVDPAPDARISAEEVFGPVVAVFPVHDLAEAARRANAIPFAFQAAVFTRSIDTALGAFRLFDASAMMVNDHSAFRADWMPFSGLNRSGLGTGGVAGSIEDMSVRKMLVMRSPALAA